LPEVDFMIVCDYVRADQGVLHMIAAGVDRVFASEVPTGRNVGIGIRLLLTRNECGRPHQLELIFQDEDGVRLTEFTGQFVAEYPPNLPGGQQASVVMPLNIGLPYRGMAGTPSSY